MAYEKKTWETGEVITADGLNHIEQGIADCGGIEIISVSVVKNNDEYTVTETSHTFTEIKAMVSQGKEVMARVAIANGSYSPHSSLLMANVMPIQAIDSYNLISFQVVKSDGIPPVVTSFELVIASDENRFSTFVAQ